VAVHWDAGRPLGERAVNRGSRVQTCLQNNFNAACHRRFSVALETRVRCGCGASLAVRARTALPDIALRNAEAKSKVELQQREFFRIWRNDTNWRNYDE
jgi:hypothetical protein